MSNQRYVDDGFGGAFERGVFQTYSHAAILDVHTGELLSTNPVGMEMVSDYCTNLEIAYERRLQGSSHAAPQSPIGPPFGCAPTREKSARERPAVQSTRDASHAGPIGHGPPAQTT